MCYERADFEREQDDFMWGQDQEQQGQQLAKTIKVELTERELSLCLATLMKHVLEKKKPNLPEYEMLAGKISDYLIENLGEDTI